MQTKIEKKFTTYLRWLFSHMINHKILFFLNILGIFLVTLTRTVIPIRIGKIIDNVRNQGFAIDLIGMIGILFGLFLIRNLIEYATWMIGHRLGSKTEQSMRKEFFDTIQEKPLRFHDQIKTGDLQALATNDLRVVNTMIAHGSFYIYPFFQATLTIILQINTFDYRMGLITAPFLLIYVYFVLKYRKELTPYSKQALTKHAAVTVKLQESLNGIQVTRAFSAENLEYKRFRRVVKAYRKNWLGENRVQSRFYPLLVLYAAVGTTFLLGSNMVIDNQLSVGGLTAINLLLITLFEPTGMIFWATKDMIGGFGASERLYAILETDNSEKEPISRKNDFERLQGHIEFRSVTFRYEQKPDQNLPLVLQDISFQIKANQRVAIVGPTGCGKTTLAKLLLRLYEPQEGTIFLDGNNIQDYPIDLVRKRIGFIEQDIFLFSQTIRENIKFGNPDASDEDMIKVAKLAQVHDFVKTFPNGYDTIVGERGTKLSGGEKQRIAIARAFLTDPDIVILDDSMSAIDSETEEKIGLAIQNILQDRTTLIITHRLHTIRTSDKILVMKNGKIIDQGSHEALIARSQDYQKIFGKQLDHLSASSTHGGH